MTGGEWRLLFRKKGGSPIWVNMAQAKTVEPLASGCRVVFLGGSRIEVSESREKVVPKREVPQARRLAHASPISRREIAFLRKKGGYKGGNRIAGAWRRKHAPHKRSIRNTLRPFQTNDAVIREGRDAASDAVARRPSGIPGSFSYIFFFYSVVVDKKEV